MKQETKENILADVYRELCELYDRNIIPVGIYENYTAFYQDFLNTSYPQKQFDNNLKEIKIIEQFKK